MFILFFNIIEFFLEFIFAAFPKFGQQFGCDPISECLCRRKFAGKDKL
jgi:hypothetical protein